jgi:hypothetical protein
MPRECDGSCLVHQTKSEEIRCEDGEILRFYWCSHEKTWILTTYAPPTAVES